MNKDQLLTITDLQDFENRISRRLDAIEANIQSKKTSPSKNYFRTKGVKELLTVSDNKLKTMRENGEIPFSFIGSTYYYPEDEILAILKENTINKQD